MGDGGKDGEAVAHITLWNPGEAERDTRIYAEVKSGKPTLTQVRAFCHTIEKHDAIGIFITIEPVSDGMRQEAADMGTFTHNNDTYPRLQFWQITEAYFENPEIVNQLIRTATRVDTTRSQSAERHDSPEHAKAKGEHDRKMGNGNKIPLSCAILDKASREKRERNKMAIPTFLSNAGG